MGVMMILIMTAAKTIFARLASVINLVNQFFSGEQLQTSKDSGGVHRIQFGLHIMKAEDRFKRLNGLVHIYSQCGRMNAMGGQYVFCFFFHL